MPIRCSPGNRSQLLGWVFSQPNSFYAVAWRNIFLSFSITLLAFSLASCGIDPSKVTFLSSEDERRLGARYHPLVIQRYGLYSDSGLVSYIHSVAKRIVAVTSEPQRSLNIFVLDSKSATAFALPGNYLYITRGLLALLNSEDELAALLAHEIAHLEERHGAKRYSYAKLTEWAGALVSRVDLTADNRLLESFAQVVGGNYGQDQESEADRLAVTYLSKSGYRSAAIIDLLDRLKANSEYQQRNQQLASDSYHGLASHPEHEKRLHDLVEQLSEDDDHERDKIHRRLYLEQLNGLVYGESANEGILHGQTLYHAGFDFAITLPTGWAINNQSEFLQAQLDNEVISRIHVLTYSGDYTPLSFIWQHLNLEDVQQGGSLNHPIYPGYSTLTSVSTPWGQRLGRLIVLLFEQKALVIIGAGADPISTAHFDDHLLQTAQSFHRLSNEERPLAEAFRIRILHTDSKIDVLAKQSPLGKRAVAQLRLLNPMPNQELIKFIE